MPKSLLNDGRTVDNTTIVDFDETHRNCVNALTDDERAMFVKSEIPDPPPPQPPPPPTPREKLDAMGLTDADTLAVLKSMLDLLK